MFHIAVPTERWEVEVFADGHVEFERFASVGEIADNNILLTLIDQFKD